MYYCWHTISVELKLINHGHVHLISTAFFICKVNTQNTGNMPCYIYLRQNMMINTAHHNLNKTRLTDQVHAEFKQGHLNMKRIRLQETIGLFIKIISTC